MNPVSPWPAAAALLAAAATAHLLVRRVGAPLALGRYASIDGLRGYLAFFVFLHHSSIWYFYLRTGQWEVPPSHLYTHFGQSSVSMFFMITGFLFFSKLIDGRRKGIDWDRLFVSRFLRLVPLYTFVMLLLFLAVFAASQGKFLEPLPNLLIGAAKWLSFLGSPPLNGFEHTSTIVPAWTLRYEWVFYFSLPVLAVTLGGVPPLPYLVLGVAILVGVGRYLDATLLMPFAGGIIASLCCRFEVLRSIAAKHISSFVALGCVAAAIGFYPSAYSAVPLILLSVAFAIIACGNTLFGVLVSPHARTLGEISYSLYLLHGLFLFVTFTFIVGLDNARALSPLLHWALTIAIAPILILSCFSTFKLIERPALQRTDMVTVWFRARVLPPSLLR
jgi:peptidoglycan/LPS O-acetylase OafA/YrhL